MPHKINLSDLAQCFADGRIARRAGLRSTREKLIMQLLDVDRELASMTHPIAPASSIRDLVRREGDEHCPSCWGSNGMKSLMKPLPLPIANEDDEDFWKCSVCNMKFAQTSSDLWRVVDG